MADTRQPAQRSHPGGVSPTATLAPTIAAPTAEKSPPTVVFQDIDADFIIGDCGGFR